MRTVAGREAFALWLTGLPASGKSCVTAELARKLEARGLRPAILESDVLRKVFTPDASYDEHDRDHFYRQVAYVGSLLVEHGVPVIIDATANLRRYREHARRLIPRFFEVYVDTPLAVCVTRDPKGIYRGGQSGANRNVPGLQVPYEPPDAPDWVVHGESVSPAEAAEEIIRDLHLADDLPNFPIA